MARAFSQVLIEAIIVGIVMVVLGYLIGWATTPFFGASLPAVCKVMDNKYMMEVNLFLIGFFFWFGAEYSGSLAYVCNNIAVANA